MARKPISNKRRTGLQAALKLHGLSGWLEAIVNLKGSALLCSGENDRKWKADLDWLIDNPDKLQRLIEGRYGNGLHPNAPADPLEAKVERLLASPTGRGMVERLGLDKARAKIRSDLQKGAVV